MRNQKNNNKICGCKPLKTGTLANDAPYGGISLGYELFAKKNLEFQSHQCVFYEIITSKPNL